MSQDLKTSWISPGLPTRANRCHVRPRVLRPCNCVA